MSEPAALLSQLPSVDRVLSSPAAAAMLSAFSRDAVAEAVRGVLEELRRRIRCEGAVDAAELGVEQVVSQAGAVLSGLSAPKLRRVINATGVVLHTNLGRAALASSAIDAVVAAAAGACNLEYDVARAGRGDRDELVEEHLCALTGAEAATVVNNNAAAVILVLNSLAEGREVVVSRGELIEIGGSFRIPDIMSKSGARLREVGTTNRTHASDYRDAIGPDTALLMKVHTSNYRIIGFCSTVELEALAALAASHPGLLVVEDLGAGALVDFSKWGLPAEPVVADRLSAGADLVTCSGDKLLGGPQCGIVVGRSDLIARLKRNPLRRALRCDSAPVPFQSRFRASGADAARSAATAAGASRTRAGRVAAAGAPPRTRGHARTRKRRGPGRQRLSARGSHRFAGDRGVVTEAVGPGHRRTFPRRRSAGDRTHRARRFPARPAHHRRPFRTGSERRRHGRLSSLQAP